LAGLLKLILVVMPIPPNANRSANPDGYAIFPVLTGRRASSIPLSDSVNIVLSGGFEAILIRAEIRPDDTTIAVSSNDTRLDALAKLTARSAAPWVLLGTADSSRIEVAEAHAALSARGAIDRPDFRIEVGADRAALVVDTSEGDSFLQAIFGAGQRRIDLSTAIGWSSRTGLDLRSQAGFETTIPLHLTISDTIHVQSVTLALRAGSAANSTELQAGLSGDATIGPVTVTIEQVGLLLSFRAVSRTEPPGNFGDIDLGFGFKPPNGLGISIDAGSITGGGFLSFDAAAARYSGALQLEVYGIQVKAFGLLDTHLPGGEPGYSFLILISTEFDPIQLGYGFTLNGVGGLIGIHRSVNIDALRAGLRTHTLDHLLFPHDVVANAPQIISDARAVFPPTPGRHIFGPLGLIGWGKSLVEARIGLALEEPEPIRLVLVGLINAALPTKDDALIELHLDIDGVIDFGQKLLAIDSVLHDSHIAFFTVSGDAALRLSWGESPTFAFSIGGFNPHYQNIPPGFPSLRPLTLALINDEDLRLTLQAYLALTSNTLQFGAKAELYAAASGFNIYGWVGFDALFVCSPFSFTTDISAGVALRVGSTEIAGIHVHGRLSGTTPWHVRGEACLDLFFFDICVPFETSFGGGTPAIVRPGDPWLDLHNALQDPRNWSPALPPAALRVVSLSSPAGSPPDGPEGSHGGALFDPVGGLRLHEKVLPLNHPITRYDALPTTPDTFTILGVTVGSAASAWTLERDYFAAAQFEDLTDAEKLSRPSFEPMDAGLTVAAESTAQGAAVLGITIEYETRIVDSPSQTFLGHPYSLTLTRQLALTRDGPAARASLVTAGFRKFAPASAVPTLVQVADERFVIASTLDLSMRSDLTAPVTKGAAYLTLETYLATHPAERDLLQVVPQHEVEAAA
jgi:hypothetical protein